MNEAKLLSYFQPLILVDAFFHGIELDAWLQKNDQHHPLFRKALVRAAELLVYGRPERSRALIEQANKMGVRSVGCQTIAVRCAVEKGEFLSAELLRKQLDGAWRKFIHARILLHKNEIPQGMALLGQLVGTVDTPPELYAEALLWRMQIHAKQRNQAKTLACFVKLQQFAKESKADKTLVWLATMHQLMGGNPAAERLAMAMKLSQLYSEAMTYADCTAQDITPIPLVLHALLRQTNGKPNQALHKLSMMITLETRLERTKEVESLFFWGQKLLGRLYGPQFATAMALLQTGNPSKPEG